MKKKTHSALEWIVTILNDNHVPYRIGGGLAIHLYGASRAVNDIDISLSGKYFPIIVPLIKDFVTAGPKHYLNEKWDCTTLSLNYYGQDIDLTDADTLLMRNKEGNRWMKNKDIYEKYPDRTIEMDGIKITLMHPRALLEYKKELDGEHQNSDRIFLENYIHSESR